MSAKKKPPCVADTLAAYRAELERLHGPEFAQATRITHNNVRVSITPPDNGKALRYAWPEFREMIEALKVRPTPKERKPA